MPDLVGEILHERYAVLEHLAGEHFLVYDLQALRKRTVRVDAVGRLISDRSPARLEVKPTRPTRRPATAPRVAVPPRVVAAPQRAAQITRFEAAWFAHGEQLELEEEGVREISDYTAYQLLLERLALQMP